MKKFVYLIFILAFVGCDSDNTNDCIQTAGNIVNYEVELEEFHEIFVYERVKLFIEQGEQQKVEIETGSNLRNDVSAIVEDGRLILRNDNSCNLFRDYEITKVYVTTPRLTWLQSSTGSAIESIGNLAFEEELWLRSLNQEKSLDIHTDGDFILDLDMDRLRITSDNVSNFFLTGRVDVMDVFFAAGDGLLEASALEVQDYDVFHRGTNRIIIKPLQSLKGDIYSYGDIISKSRPPSINVTEHFKGRLIFDTD